MKSNLPKKLRIGSQTYDVKYTKDLKTPWGQPAYGIHTFDDLSIEINSDAEERIKYLYILHEALHGLFCSQEIGIDGATEEKVVLNLTHGLAAFIKDNPDYIKQLMRS